MSKSWETHAVTMRFLNDEQIKNYALTNLEDGEFIKAVYSIYGSKITLKEYLRSVRDKTDVSYPIFSKGASSSIMPILLVAGIMVPLNRDNWRRLQKGLEDCKKKYCKSVFQKIKEFFV